MPGQAPPLIFMILSGLLGIGLLVTLIVISFRNKTVFPKRPDSPVLFRESGASGASQANLMTKFGGASGVLEVLVTEDELWIRPGGIFAIFNVIAKPYDLLHRVPIDHVWAADVKRRRVTLTFQRPEGREVVFKLYLRRPNEFVDSLRLVGDVREA